jgi:hypothetical protein
MLPKPLSASLIICEKVLSERDGVHSAIRVADTFFVTGIGTPPGIPIGVLAVVVYGSEDGFERLMRLRLERPNGDIAYIDDGQRVSPGANPIPGGHKGAYLTGNFIIPVGEIGSHALVLSLDGEDVARSLFTISLPLQR